MKYVLNNYKINIHSLKLCISNLGLNNNRKKIERVSCVMAVLHIQSFTNTFFKAHSVKKKVATQFIL